MDDSYSNYLAGRKSFNSSLPREVDGAQSYKSLNSMPFGTFQTPNKPKVPKLVVDLEKLNISEI